MTSTTRNLLVELFVEELPPKALRKLGDAFAGVLASSLRTQGLAADASAVTAYASPRRLGAHVTAVRERADDKAVAQKLMPASVGLGADGQPTPALLKKLAALGADASAVPTLQRRPDGKAEALFFESVVAGATLAEGLQRALDEAIARLPIPKVMLYQLADGWQSVQFVRPAHGLVALHGDAVVPVAALGLAAGRHTHGHRFESAGDPIEIADADGYAELLATRGAVIAGFDARRAEIARQLGAAAAARGLAAIDDPALLDEVSGLVEWPVALIGSIDARFMDLPPEVLTTTMRANQKYFALETHDGALAPRFVVVANVQAEDGGDAIVAGNERVLRARLSDARFFCDQDRKTPLVERVPKLDTLVFHAKLGSIGERVTRLVELADQLGRAIGTPEQQRFVRRAALLCKADLVTGMVGEFPELQGKMGRYYALADGEDVQVAEAVADHYAPLGPSDRVPTAPVSVALAIADKLDTLTGFFAVGETPTGSKDPFALRRAALGIIRLIVENGVRLPLRTAIRAAYDAYAGQPAFAASAPATEADVARDLLDFFADRLRAHLRSTGARHDLIAAVFELGDEDDLLRLLARVDALAAFLAGEDGANLLTAYKRASNIVRREEAKDGVRYDGAPDPALFVSDEERRLAGELERATGEIRERTADDDFAGAMRALARLRQFVDVFFDEVTVNADDPALRANRLRLLARIRSALGAVADFSKIEGG